MLPPSSLPRSTGNAEQGRNQEGVNMVFRAPSAVKMPSVGYLGRQRTGCGVSRDRLRAGQLLAAFVQGSHLEVAFT